MLGPAKLTDRFREALRSRHYSPRTEEAYVTWVRRYVRFHKLRHPREMAEGEINAFLTYLALKEKTQRLDAEPGTLRAALLVSARDRSTHR